MSLVVLNCPLSSSCNPVAGNFTRLRGRGRSVGLPPSLSSSAKPSDRRSRVAVTAFLFDPNREPILKEALKEPVAFMGGMFAGLLRLDLNEDPLKEWITRTVEASGITEEEIDTDDAQPEEAPQRIEIE